MFEWSVPPLYRFHVQTVSSLLFSVLAKQGWEPLQQKNICDILQKISAPLQSSNFSDKGALHAV
jgi:hypothetical protein